LPTLSDGKEVEVVTNWPGKAGTNTDLFEKVPSKIAYRDENPDATKAKSPGGVLWGYEVKPSSVSYSWTKLLLDHQTERPDYDDTTNGVSEESEDRGLLRLPNGKTAVEVVTDYLRKLYKHCMKTLEKHYATFLGITPIEFWFTMPAIWSDQAQNATRQAALKAGFGSRPLDTIRMITEPEAGVLAAMKTQVEITKEALEVCGGLL
jgi:molecular chaperone DnaK (HSP70)